MAIVNDSRKHGHGLPERFALDQQLCFVLYETTNALQRVYRRLLKSHRLTYLQYLVILVLLREGSCSLKNLADKLSLDSPSLTPVVKRLEKNGLVNRTRNPDDERTLVIELTDLGRSLLDAIPDIQTTISNCWGLPPAQISRFREMLGVVKDSLMAQP